MSRRSTFATRCTRLGVVTAVAGALVTVPNVAHAATPAATWHPPTSRVVMLNPPFSVNDVRNNPKMYAPRDGSPAAYVYTTPGTDTVLHVLDTLYPGASASLSPEQREEFSRTSAATDSTLVIIGKTGLPRLDVVTPVPLPVSVNPTDEGGCPDENQCAYFDVIMWTTKPPNEWLHRIETIHETRVLENDGGTPTVNQSNFVFKDNQGETWTDSFFRDGYNNRSYSGNAGPGVKEFYVTSYATGEIPQFDGINVAGVPLPGLRTSTNITSGSCNTITQSYDWRSPIVTPIAAVAKDTWGFSGWNTNPLNSGDTDYSYAKTFLAPCDQLQYL